jgi:hypothetical protein
MLLILKPDHRLLGNVDGKSDIERILPIHEWELEPTQIEEAVMTKLYSQLLDCYTVLGSVVSGKEAKRLFL